MDELCTCTRCGTVSFVMAREKAEETINQFNEYYDKLDPKTQQEWYRGQKSSLDDYTCLGCKGTEFREYQEGDCPEGCTLSPVIWDKT